MESIEQIKAMIEAGVPGARLDVIPNDSPCAQVSLLIQTHDKAVEIARFLKDDPRLRLDYLSNVTGVDWLDLVLKEKVKVKKVVDGVEKEFEETVERKRPGYFETVYHLYSMELRHGPLILRFRSPERKDPVRFRSLTPVWRGAEFQEREVFDLYGIHFEGHPDLRRILMWDGFKDYPMRKDYQDPDDYEWEPTPHDEVLERARLHAQKEGRP